MDFTRPERCQWQRTGREDRRSKFYEISDNLRPGPHPCNDDRGGTPLLVVSHLANERVSSSGKVSRGSGLSATGRLAEFETLYRAQVAAVTAFFARRSHEPEEVADLTADTFVEAMQSFGSSPPAEGSERAWLFAIARRVYARHCERMTRLRDAADRDVARMTLDEDEIEETGRADRRPTVGQRAA